MNLLANRPRASGMDERQRRAMFARLHGGGGGRPSSVPGDGTSPGTTSQSLEPPPLTGAELADLPPWDSRYVEGGSVSSADADVLAVLPFLRGTQTFAGNIYGGMGRAGEILADWKTPLAALVASLGLGKVRDKYPTMDPRTEKALAIAQQLAAYTAALTGLGAVRKGVAGVMPETTASVSSLLRDLGEAMALSGKTLAETLPPGVRAALETLHGGYTKVADVTGASLSDVLSLPSVPARLRAAAGLRREADDLAAEAGQIPGLLDARRLEIDGMRAQADQILAEAERKAQQAWEEAIADSAQAREIVRTARTKALDMKDQAGRILKSSHKGSLAEWDSASRMYAEGADKWWQSETGLHAAGETARALEEAAARKMSGAVAGQRASRTAADQMRASADQAQAELERYAAQSQQRLSEGADALRTSASEIERGASMTRLKSALVAAGFVAKEVQEEGKIRDLQARMEEKFASGEDFVLPAEEARGVAGTLAAGLAGTLGNPIEKQFRYGEEAYDAGVAHYRARYDAISAAEQSGELTPAEAQTMRIELSKYKPRNMAGKGPWTFAPAATAFATWQGSNLADYFGRDVQVGKVDQVLDGDTILVDGRPVRMLGVDTPESVHPDKPVEYLGPESSEFQKRNLSGKTVKLVQDPGAKYDKYGRELAYVETLPGPFDAALNLPGIGKWLPAADQNLNTIEAGFGQPRYLELSGGHGRQIEYDKATARAKAAGIGVHSPEGLEQLDYHYRTWDEKHGREPGAPTSPYSDIGTALGAGLMLTGQSGALRGMGPAGTAVAQTWNAALAGVGVADYNAKAGARTNALVFRPPKNLRTGYQNQLDAARQKRSTPRR